MRHRKAGRKLGLNSSQRQALLRGLAISLVLHERIRTTLARAKELRSISDRLITLGKKGDLAARRLAASALNSKEAVKKLFNDLGPRFQGRAGGYTRLVKTGWRAGDGASLCFIEFVSEEGVKKKVSQRKKEKKAKAASPQPERGSKGRPPSPR